MNQKSRVFGSIMNRFDAVTTVNKRWAEEFSKKSVAKVFYTPNGVEITESTLHSRKKLGLPEKEVLVLYVGALRKVKGADILFKTARILFKSGKPIRFVVAGPGKPEKFSLENLHNLTFLGRIPPDKMVELYSVCDIFVLPSRHEGRPNALLEAMASGLPSVATRLPGVVEVLNEKSGFVVDIEDANALAEAIHTLADQPEIRQKMGKNAKKRIKELSLGWDKSAEAYLNIFKKILTCAE